jgi:hypothetical protein
MTEKMLADIEHWAERGKGGIIITLVLSHYDWLVSRVRYLEGQLDMANAAVDAAQKGGRG